MMAYFVKNIGKIKLVHYHLCSHSDFLMAWLFFFLFFNQFISFCCCQIVGILYMSWILIPYQTYNL